MREKERVSLVDFTVHADQQCIYKLRGVGSYLYAIPRPAVSIKMQNTDIYQPDRILNLLHKSTLIVLFFLLN